eukprot:CAMPEP_0118856366 /NCGR_PEP_ID=MMETSP1163-20130328/3859_1 /TAXON_ID=124430 /ORGANISM="Phaeomonas parva, Strain CCMP2877" /LENGTH=264 /DNA_ID=CAMNT_0006789455 /DNA_START=106 /DNA_END=900 /DNA_ORIENTATION=+
MRARRERRGKGSEPKQNLTLKPYALEAGAAAAAAAAAAAGLEPRLALAAGELGVVAHLLALAALALLLQLDPLLALLRDLRLPRPLRRRRALAHLHALCAAVAQPLRRAVALLHGKAEVILLALRRIRVVNDESASKTRLLGTLRYEHCLLRFFRVELQRRARRRLQAGVERVEKAHEPVPRHVRILVRVAEPLQCRDTNGAVKGAGAEREALAHITSKHITQWRFPGGRDAKHIRGDVAAHPDVAVLFEHGAAQTRAAADVEN